MIKHTMQITIVDDRNKKTCDGNCGLDWASAENIALAGQQLRERFGDKVQLEYLDLSKSARNSRIAEFKRQIESGNLSLPLLLVNGKSRISGQFDIRMLLDIVEAETEIAFH